MWKTLINLKIRTKKLKEHQDIGKTLEIKSQK